MNRFPSSVFSRWLWSSRFSPPFGLLQSSSSFSTSVSHLQTPGKGQVALKTPVKVFCEKGKTYNWCACGLSKKQPLCDSSHKQAGNGIKPIQFIAPETKEYIFCNCKQTDKRPFCDETHKKL